MICLRETPREDTEILTRREGTRMCEIYARFGFDGGMFAAYSLRVVEGTSRVVVGVPAAGAGSRPTVRVHFMCVWSSLSFVSRVMCGRTQSVRGGASTLIACDLPATDREL